MPLTTCPACGSEDIRRLAALWREGVSVHRAGLLRVPMGQSQTLASIGAAPPEPRSLWGPVLVFFAVPALALHALADQGAPRWLRGVLFWALSIILTWRIVQVVQYNAGPHRAELQRWEESFRCVRCDHVFQPEMGA